LTELMAQQFQLPWLSSQTVLRPGQTDKLYYQHIHFTASNQVNIRII